MIYEINPIESNIKSVLIIHLLDEKSYKPTPIFSTMIEKVSSFQEREALSFLFLEEQRFHPTSSYQPTHRFHLPYAKSPKALKLLAATGKLYFKQKPLICDFFGKTEFFLQVSNEEKFNVQGMLKIGSQEFSLETCDFVCGSTPPWVIKSPILRFISDEVEGHLVKEIYQKSLSKEKFQQLIQSKEDETPKIIFKGNSAEQLKQQSEPTPLLILKDKSGAFADLWMDYEEGKKFAYHHLAPLPPSESSLRNIVAEKGWERDLLETNYLRKEMNQSHYYCPMDKVVKSLTFLLEIGWKILDYQGNRVMKQTDLSLALETINPKELRLKGKLHYGDHETDISKVVGSFNRREQFITISAGITGLLPERSDLKGFEDIIENGEIVGEQIRLKKTAIGSLTEFFKNHAQLTLDLPARHLWESLQSINDTQRVLPGTSFMGQLRPYQEEGLRWLIFLYEHGLHGILADDMGLGKTIQVLAWLSKVQMRAPILIVTPTSLLFNWKQEIENFLSGMSVLIHQGPHRFAHAANWEEPVIILTSYTTLRLDLSHFKQIHFQALILDESQAIKNSESQIAQSIYQLKSDFRLSITGTPIENHLGELWSQFHFLMPGLLGEKKQFEREIQLGSSDFRYLQKIKKKIKPFILRRKKEEVAKDLPEKIEQIVWVEMGEEQRKIYENFLSGIKNSLFKKVKADGMTKHRLEVFEAILRLRQICCHPLLVSSLLGEQINSESAKIETLLQDITTAIEERRKVLVFSQFTSMLSLIGKEFNARGWSYVSLDGSTSDREKVVAKFQEDDSIPLFLISLKAGGVGLNLTKADYVFIYDPWWNDAVENQAIHRAHRIGRQETVVAKRYVTLESIEEKMMTLKGHKNHLVSDILDQEYTQLNLSLEDLQFLL